MLPTKFASAERETPENLQKQIKQFSELPPSYIIVDSIPGFVLLLNANRQTVYMNKSFAEHLRITGENHSYGLRPGEILKCRHAYESEGGCGTTEFCSVCGVLDAILSAQKGIGKVNECRISLQNGNSLDLKVYANPFNYNNETYTICSITDISDEKRRRTLERIFFHDIMNSVGAIKFLSETLPEAGEEEIKEFAQTLTLVTSKLIEEINAQKVLTGAENNELQVEITRISIKELLNDILNFFSYSDMTNARSVQLDKNIYETEILSDNILLRRVIINMVKNAIEAAPKGGIITIFSNKIDGNIEISVHNPGFIPREVQLQIFQRSFSTKGKDRGLGTYSMKLLSECYLKGKVTFTTDEKEGTIFTLTIPVDYNTAANPN